MSVADARRVGSNPTMRLKTVLSCLVVLGTEVCCAAQEWPPLWKSYSNGFLDGQIRVIDRDAGDRTTSEAQAYAMFFALVANDRMRFDELLQWTEKNLASGDLTLHLPAWLWGRDRNDQWGVLDANASDADVWMVYTLFEAGKAWNKLRYTSIGHALASRIVAEEVSELPDIGGILMPAPKGFHDGESYRLNVSYLPVQLFVRLGHLIPEGPWGRIAERIPMLVGKSAPRGFAMDWLDFRPPDGFKPSALGSYDAIRVYLWAGMVDRSTPGRDALLTTLPGMVNWLRANSVPPAKVNPDGSVADPRGPIGFSAALLPYLSALGETALEQSQLARVRSALDTKTGLYGDPARYYDQNLVLFALGWRERQFWFDSQGALKLRWKDD
jgi:endoglucanase